MIHPILAYIAAIFMVGVSIYIIYLSLRVIHSRLRIILLILSLFLLMHGSYHLLSLQYPMPVAITEILIELIELGGFLLLLALSIILYRW